MGEATKDREIHWSNQLLKLSYHLTILTVVITLFISVYIVIFGSNVYENRLATNEFRASVTRLGTGLGGLYGFPWGLLSVYFLMAIPSFIFFLVNSHRMHDKFWIAVLGVVGPFFVSFGFFQVAHLLDPCYHGIFDLGDEHYGVRMCELFGDEINTHTRIHAFWHVINAIPFLLVYRFFLKQYHPMFKDSVVMDFHR